MNLAGGLTKAGYRVLVIDADPQASATMWSLARGQGSLPFEVQTIRQLRGRYRELVDSPDHDIVLIDSPPGVTERENAGSALEVRRILKWADMVLVPLRPSTLDFSAAATFVRYLEGELEAHKSVLVLINARQHNTLMSKQASAQASVLFASLPGSRILETQIGLRTAVTEVSGSGKTIFDYAPASEAAREYFNLTKEVIQCLANAQHSVSTNYTSLSPSVPSQSSLMPSTLRQ